MLKASMSNVVVVVVVVLVFVVVSLLQDGFKEVVVG